MRPFSVAGAELYSVMLFSVQGTLSKSGRQSFLKLRTNQKKIVLFLKAEEMLILTLAKARLSSGIFVVVSLLFTNPCFPQDTV